MTQNVTLTTVPQTSREANLLSPHPTPLPQSEREAKVSGTLRAYLFDRKNFLARLDERAETLHQNGYLAWATNGSGVFAVTLSLKEGEKGYLVHAVDRTCTCPFYTKQLEEEPLTEDGTFVECKHLRGLCKLVVKSGEMHKKCEDWKSYYALRTHWIGTIAERRRRELGLAPCKEERKRER